MSSAHMENSCIPYSPQYNRQTNTTAPAIFWGDRGQFSLQNPFHRMKIGPFLLRYGHLCVISNTTTPNHCLTALRFYWREYGMLLPVCDLSTVSSDGSSCSSYCEGAPQALHTAGQYPPGGGVVRYTGCPPWLYLSNRNTFTVKFYRILCYNTSEVLEGGPGISTLTRMKF